MNTTQVCRKCRLEKPLTEYHRRGTSHQRICKSCRKAHIPSGKKRIVFLNDQSLYPALSKRIEQLENRLRAKAASYSNDPHEAEDLYGAMQDEILFKSKPEDSDARILTRATWAAKAVLRQYKTYSALVEDETSMLIRTDDEDLEFFVSPSQSAEDDFIHRENMGEILKVIAHLPKEYQVIVSMLALGYNQRKIAEELKKSDQVISIKIKNIATELTTLGISISFA